jgi:two-component system sensor histidine kinase YesM
MNIRYNGKLDVDFDFDDRLMKYNMPRMLLQPLLENSIIHGFVNMGTGCKISVKAKQRGDIIYFNVTDNGRGIDKDRLSELHDRLNIDPEAARGFENIALVNIKNRLYYSYGEAGQVKITSAKNAGVEVSITLSIAEKRRD